MSSVTTQSFQVTQVFGNASGLAGNRLQQEIPHPSGPKIIEMDLDTVEGHTNLDHTHQKGRSELAQRGSLGQRRPPTRAGIRAFASAVWEQKNEEGYSTVSSEDGIADSNNHFPKSGDCRDEPEGKEDETGNEEETIMSDQEKPARGWKQPPKHAVLVFPMQLLDSNKFKETETVIRESEQSHRNIFIEEPTSISSESIINKPVKNSSTTVTITPESETESAASSSSEEEQPIVKSKVAKRLSAPTIVSITLKEPTALKSSQSVDSLSSEDPFEMQVNPVSNPMVITIGDLRCKSFDNRSYSETFLDSKHSDLNSFRGIYTKEQISDDEEDTRRNMGVQVRIKGRKATPTSPTRDRKDNHSTNKFISSNNQTNKEELGKVSVCKTSHFVNSNSGYSSEQHQNSHHHSNGNTVVFIKPTGSPGSNRRSTSGTPLSPDRSTISSRMKWNRNSGGDEEETKENQFNLQEQVFSSTRERRASISSVDRHSVTSMESSKDDSPERNSKKSERQQQQHRVQIQTWDRRIHNPKSPSPSRSQIRQLVLSRGKSASPLRPASVIGDDGENERFGRKEQVDAIGYSSRRSSPTGHRYVARPVLSEKENKPEWLKKIDLNRRRVIDWDNLGNIRKSDEIESNSPTDKTFDRYDRSSDILPDLSPTRYSEEFSNQSFTSRNRSHSDSFLLEEEDTRDINMSLAKVPEFEVPKGQEPEWIRIARMRRRNSINWEEIAATRKAEGGVPEPKSMPPMAVSTEDQSESHNVGCQANIRRPDSKSRSASKDRRTSPSRKPSSAASRIPRCASGEELKSEVNVIQNILSKVRASQEPRDSRTPESKPKLKEEGWTTARSPSPWRQSAPPLYRWPDTEKEVVIEELPKASKDKPERLRSPSPVGNTHCERTSRTRAARDYRKERPRSMVELGTVSPKRRPSPPMIPRSPSPRSSTSESVKIPFSRNGRPSRRQPSPDEQISRNYNHGRVKSSDIRRSRSVSHDKLSTSMSSGSEQEGQGESGCDLPANKKKVRFLINRENGLQLERPQTDTTYTMFGMDRIQPANTRRAKTDPEIDLNQSKTEPISNLNEDDYQLQAYKIINHIKQLSKEGTNPKPSPEASRGTSPTRIEHRDLVSPDHNLQQYYTHQNRPHKAQEPNQNERQPVRRNNSKNVKTKEIDLRRRDESPISSDSSRKESSQSDSNAPKQIGRKSPEWMNKALHKQKSPVDWESLERGPNTESNKPMWAGVKLKKTPYSTKFLAENSDAENGDVLNLYYGSDVDGVAPYDSVFDPRDECYSADLGPLSMEGLGDNEEVSLHVEKRRINREVDFGSSSPSPVDDHCHLKARKDRFPPSRVLRKGSFQNGFGLSKKSESTVIIQDSEGYSSMESCFSSKLPSSCKHCGHSQEENSSNSSSLCNDIIEEVMDPPEAFKQTDLPINGNDDENGWGTCCFVNDDANDPSKEAWLPSEGEEIHQYSEPTLPPPPPLSVSLAIDPNCPQEYSNQMYQSMDFYQQPVRSKPRRSVSMRVNSNQDLSAFDGPNGDSSQVRGKHNLPVRRNSLSETRQKLLDILTTKSNKRGPQIKTIRKTIRRILRGTEVTDEEEEIVEEITEEVFGIPEKSSKSCAAKKLKGQSTITRTVHQTKDGRKFLTTTILDGGQLESSMVNHTESQRNPVTVNSQRVYSEDEM